MKYMFFLFLNSLLIAGPKFSHGQINNFIIDGKIKGIDTGRVFISIDNGGKTIASAKIESGKFVLSGRIDEPEKCTIFTNFNYDAIPVFLENAHYVLIINNSPFNYKIQGGKLNEEFMQYGNAVMGYYEGVSELGRIVRDKIWQKDDPNLKVVKGKLDSSIAYLENKAIEFSGTFIRNNLNSYIAPRMISNILLFNKKYVEIASDYYAMLDPKIQESFEGKDLKREIDRVLNSVKIGTTIELPGLKNEQNHFVELKKPGEGRYLLLNFWASWCLPCVVEFPDLKKIYTDYKGKGFDIVNISLDTDKEKWIKFIKTNSLPGIQLVDFADSSKSFARKYRIYSIPSNFLIDDHLKIIGSNLSMPDLEAVLKKKLNNLK